MTLGNIYLDLNKKAMAAYHKAVTKQGHFWCAICGEWFEEKKIETASTQTFFKPNGKMACACFGVCEPCKRHAGRNLHETVHGAIAERLALRAAAGESPEDKDPRVKSVIVTEEELSKK